MSNTTSQAFRRHTTAALSVGSLHLSHTGGICRCMSAELRLWIDETPVFNKALCLDSAADAWTMQTALPR